MEDKTTCTNCGEYAGSPIADRIAALESELRDCEGYLKDGETPAQRIEREITDNLTLLKLLEKEKRKSEQLEAERDVLEKKLSEANATYTEMHLALESLQDELQAAVAENARLRYALRAIGNLETWPDNLMGDKDIARAALEDNTDD